MSGRVLVVGASGYAGRHLVVALSRAGFRVRAVVRSRSRAERPGAYGAPPLEGLVNEWVERSVAEPGAAKGVCDGVDRVVSALGVTRQRADPWDVDFLANLAVLEDALRCGVASFLYVGVMHARSGSSMILRSKAAFEAVLAHAPIGYQLVDPSGYFSDVSEFLGMARRGLVVLPPDPEVRVAPIHGADLAEFCISKLAGESGSWDVGGPEVLSYRQIAHLAFEALGKTERTLVMPRAVVNGVVAVAARTSRRPRDLAEFFADGLTTEAIGQRCGTRRLGDHFADLVRAGVG